MPYLYLAFYRAHPHGHLFDYLISAWTRSPYSHVELYFPETGVCWSSSPRDGGVRARSIDVSDPEKWTLLAVPATALQAGQLAHWCSTQAGKGYDWRGILGFTGPKALNPQDPAKWFCSEFCTAGLQQVLGLALGRRPYENSPGRLFTLFAQPR